MEAIKASLLTIPNFVAYLVVSFGLLALFATVYVKWTPYREITLIREGNTAAAYSLGGALLGFIFPLTSVIAHSVSLVDLTLWGIIAGIVQFVAYLLVRWMIPDIANGIKDNKVAHGLFLGLLSGGLGLLTGACMIP